MGYTRVLEAQQKQRDGALDLGPGYSRLVLRLMRRLAQGRPVSTAAVDQVVADLGLDRAEADAFLRRRTERDQGDNIVGIMGVSLNATPHRFAVNGVQLWSWCAVATLVLPALLQQTATIESPSPVSGEPIRLTVSPDRVEDVSPPGAAVSMVIVDPDTADTSSVEATRNTSCNHIYFFASREEGAQWAAGRDEIEILTVAEGFEAERLGMSKILTFV
ncbi:MAG: organomercurial lyase [Dehalococcoidia bacterium]